MTPQSAYLVCATPRSGSTLLCELLTATGVAGRPEEPFQQLRETNLPRQPRQYFDGIGDASVLELLKPTDAGTQESAEQFAEHLRRTIADDTTPNGVFATKLMWGYALDLFARLREQREFASDSPVEALARAFGSPAYVHVTRPDKVAQAVSLWTAVQTARWRDEGDDDGEEPPEPVYSHAGIAHLVDQLTLQDRAWIQWFRNTGVEPVTVTYDELVDDQTGTVARVLEHVGIEGAEVTPVNMRRQAGGRSAQWRARFEEERVDSTTPSPHGRP